MAEARRLRLGNDDVEALNNYFCRMQSRNSNFFYVIDVDEDSRIRNIFWVDARDIKRSKKKKVYGYQHWLDGDHDSNIIHEESRNERKKFYSPLKVRSRGRPSTKRKQSKIEQIEKRAKTKSRKKGSTIDRKQDELSNIEQIDKFSESQRLFRLDKELLVPNDIVQTMERTRSLVKPIDLLQMHADLFKEGKSAKMNFEINDYPGSGLPSLQKFVDEVMDLLELDNLKDAIVGLPEITGLSTEQRKRLPIAVALVANPSIIFMDEPTSGLDARAVAIGMRTVRNTVDTGRTVVCTIHQPSIDVFEAFDDIL
ncbi:hypothetical protein ZIOFF_020777 [Zingiber officinale]|uniref:ABC transporter domain-containing protein n=1 Tax=Zingiber officinale TaxID=94328 RepID=A0A8J5GZC6_ZINOF|nr:hypothetical protein ZIOFF_020777 [Zingiber officinale]